MSRASHIGYPICANGRVAEWLCSGLQIRVRRFNSGLGLHRFHDSIITYRRRCGTSSCSFYPERKSVVESWPVSISDCVSTSVAPNKRDACSSAIDPRASRAHGVSIRATGQRAMLTTLMRLCLLGKEVSAQGQPAVLPGTKYQSTLRGELQHLGIMLRAICAAMPRRLEGSSSGRICLKYRFRCVPFADVSLIESRRLPV